MPVGTNYAPVSYVGNGAAVDFPANFISYEPNEVLLFRETVSTGAVVLVDPSDYNVTGVPNSISVNYEMNGNPVTSAYRLWIVRRTEIEQPLNITNSSGFFPAILTRQLDRIAMIQQEQARDIDRSLKVDFGGAPMPPVERGVNGYLGWDSAGDRIILKELPDSLDSIITTLAAAQPYASVGDAAALTYPLPSAVKTIFVAGQQYERADSEPAGPKFRESLGRYTASGHLDPINGGWWEPVYKGGTISGNAIGVVFQEWHVTVDNAPLIQSALNALAARVGGGVLELGADLATTSYIGVGSTIVVPPLVELRCGPNVWLRPMSDIPVLRLKASARAYAGVDVANIGSYTSDAVQLLGSDLHQLYREPTRGRLLIFGSNGAVKAGAGLALRASKRGEYVTFVDLDITITGFAKTIVLAAVDTGGAGTVPYVNSNHIRGNIYNFETAVSLEADAVGEVVANNIRLDIQPNTSIANSQLALHATGGSIELNRLDLFVWDWFEGGVADHNLSMVLNLSGTDRGNLLITNEPGGHIRGRGYKLDGSTNLVSYGTGHVPVLNGLAYPPSHDWPSFLGNQDNFLAFADLIETVSSSAAPSSGALENIFRPDAGSFAQFNADTEIEITFASPVDYLHALGVNFSFMSPAAAVKIEVYHSGSYHTLVDLTNNIDGRVAYEVQNHILAVTKVRYTCSGFAPGQSAYVITGLFLFGSPLGRTFLPRYDPTTSVAVSGDPVGNNTVKWLAPSTTSLTVRRRDAYGNLGSAFLPTGILFSGGRELFAAEAGTRITNQASPGARADFTLPAATYGLEFEFTVVEAIGIRISPAGSNRIRRAASVTTASTGYIESTTPYSTVKLVAINPTDWIIVATNDAAAWTFT